MTRSVFLFLSAFLASGVKMVEALTIVLAIGVTRGWCAPARVQRWLPRRGARAGQLSNGAVPVRAVRGLGGNAIA